MSFNLGNNECGISKHNIRGAAAVWSDAKGVIETKTNILNTALNLEITKAKVVYLRTVELLISYCKIDKNICADLLEFSVGQTPFKS